MNEIDKITFNHPTDDTVNKLFLEYMKKQQEEIRKSWLTMGNRKWKGVKRFSLTEPGWIENKIRDTSL